MRIRNYTYAKYGRVILAQPGQFAWQVFDAKVAQLLRPEFYRRREITKVTGSTLEQLAGRLEGADPQRFLDTVREFNMAGGRFYFNYPGGTGLTGLGTGANRDDRDDVPVPYGPPGVAVDRPARQGES